MGGPTAAEALAAPSALSPVPTSIIQPVAHVVYSYTVGSTVALTTAWDEPASCATAIPTMYAGTCNTAGCTAFSASRLPSMLYTYGLTVNYPDYTTAQQLTSTNCMPPGFAPIKSMYFTGGTQCPVSWTTATVDQNSYSSSKTIVCCPTSHVATSISGNAGYDCYRNITLTAGQSIILAANGKIGTSRPATVASTVPWVSSWYSRSIIATTAWPTPTVADLFHPAVNFLVTGTPTSSSSSNSSSSSSSSAFSLFKLGLGASIGILIVLAIAGLIFLFCLYAIIRRIISGPKPVPQLQPPPPAYYPPPPVGPQSPPMEQYPTQYPSPVPPAQYGPPAQYTQTNAYPGGGQSPPPMPVQYGQGAGVYPHGTYPPQQVQGGGYGYGK